MRVTIAALLASVIACICVMHSRGQPQACGLRASDECCPNGTCPGEGLSCQERDGKLKCRPCGKGNQPACNTPPTITCPSGTVLVDDASATAYPGVSAADAEDGDLTARVTCTPPPSELTLAGTEATEVTCSVTDSSGASASCSFSAAGCRQEFAVDTTDSDVTVAFTVPQTGQYDVFTATAAADCAFCGGGVDTVITLTPPGAEDDDGVDGVLAGTGSECSLDSNLLAQSLTAGTEYTVRVAKFGGQESGGPTRLVVECAAERTPVPAPPCP